VPADHPGVSEPRGHPLPGRPAVAERLEAARAARGSATLMLVDVDGFQDVRTAYGDAAGDALLAALAPRLSATADGDDALVPLGHDGFAIVATGHAGAWEAADAARRLAAAWSAPFRVGDEEVYVSASVGVATGGAPAAELLRQADAALDRARARGCGQVELYDDALRSGARERVRLASDLRRAIAAGELDVSYQPIIELATGRPRAVEALARWNHPERGAISPGVFVPVAERTGLIGELGRHVLGTACRQLVRWREELPGMEDLWVSVNVSAHQIGSGELPGDVKDALRDSGLPPCALALEVIESAIMEETDAPGPLLALLRGLGVRVILDDFGTGYSSLSYLRRLPVDGLKLDRSFIDGVGHPDAATVLEAILGLTSRLGLLVIAEGVETHEHAERLRDLGCQLAQGYMLARPLPAAEMAAVLAEAGQARTALNES